MKLNLRNRILLPTLGLITVLTLAISLIAYRTSSKALNVSVGKEMATICHSTVDLVETWIGDQRETLTVLAGQPATQKALQTSENEELFKPLSADLERMKASFKFYEDIHLIDATGIARASSNPGSVRQLNIAERTYFKEAMAGKNSLSDALASKTTGNPIVVLAVPVKNGQATVGTLIGVLDLDWFNKQFLGDVKVLETGYIFVYDHTGSFVAHPQKEKVLKGKLSDFAWGAKVQQEGKGSLDYSFEGVTKTAVYAKSESLNWGVVATVPVREAEAAARQLAVVCAGIGAGAVGAGLVLVLLVAAGIARPIKAAVESLDAGSEQTATAAGQVSAASQTLAEGASEQAASLEETSSSLEEMASMTKRNGDNTVKAGELTRQARSVADGGVKDMETMSQAMQAIKTSSDEVGKIIKTIDEIAFQTNILALNAAVEAARAGEAGMGFAVVADEVRNLAQRSATAAKETASRIESAIEKTAQGVEVSAKVSTQLAEIVRQVRQIDELMSEITAASREQTQGIDQINLAVSQMDKVTQSNAASAEESASAAEELNAQAESIKESVRSLVALVEGTTAATGARQTPQRTPVAAAPGKAPRVIASTPRKPVPASPEPAPHGNGNETAGFFASRGKTPVGTNGGFHDA